MGFCYAPREECVAKEWHAAGIGPVLGECGWTEPTYLCTKIHKLKPLDVYRRAEKMKEATRVSVAKNGRRGPVLALLHEDGSVRVGCRGGASHRGRKDGAPGPGTGTPVAMVFVCSKTARTQREPKTHRHEAVRP